jgi:SAM-dependent methyltransferase|tara:strand:- start:129 stop:914 length:786 start_codon:yes stop_codon:yes gene_type:complete
MRKIKYISKLVLGRRFESRQQRWIVLLKPFIPSLLKKLIWKFLRLLQGPSIKYENELLYWQRHYLTDGGRFHNSQYRKKMLGMAEENDSQFLENKVVADFGCGPRGSLSWVKSAKELIGIDVLADDYALLFDLSQHNMRYVRSDEMHIPLPLGYVDVLFSLNAIDHVDNFEVMCKELFRILKPGGSFIGSFNIDMRSTINEPQTLTEKRIKNHLLDHLEVQSYRVASPGPPNIDDYCHFFDNSPSPTTGPRFIWVRATKPI